MEAKERQFLSSIFPADKLGTEYRVIRGVRQGGTGGVLHCAVDRLEDLVEGVTEYDDNYFTPSLYPAGYTGPEGKSLTRCQEDVVGSYTLFIDVDVVKPWEDADDAKNEGKYASREDARKAIDRFVKRTGLVPYIVSSGYGYHLYFPSTDFIPAEQLKDLQKRLYAAATNAGLLVDEVPYGQFLRIPGSYNPKGRSKGHGSTPVEVVTEGCIFSLDALDAVLEPIKDVTATKRYEKEKTQGEAFTVPLSAILEECPLLRASADDGGAKEDYHGWFATCGAIKYIEEQEEAIELFAGNYPGGDPIGETEKKVASWGAEGPVRCERLRNHSAYSSACSGCPHKSKGTSPVYVVKDRMALEAYKEKKAGGKDGDSGADKARKPPEYIFTDGAILKRTKEGLEEVVYYNIEVKHYVVTPTNRYYVVKIDDKIGYFSNGALMDSQRFRREFGDSPHFFGLGPSDKELLELRKAIKEYVDVHRREITPLNEPTMPGYDIESDSFVYAGIRVTADGAKEERRLFGDSLPEEMFSVGESYNKWSSYTWVYSLPEMHINGFFLLSALSAPLYGVVNALPCVIGLISDKPGVGKTITAKLAASAFASPDLLFRDGTSTVNAIIHSLATAQFLPVFADEFNRSTRRPHEFETLIYCGGNGTEKARLNKNAEALPVRKWTTPLFVTSNTFLLDSYHNQKEGVRNRIIELEVECESIPPHVADALAACYGYVSSEAKGEAGPYILQEYLKVGRDELRRRYDRLRKKYQTGNDARYGGPAFALAHIAGEILHKAGMIAFDYEAVVKTAYEQFKARLEAGDGESKNPYESHLKEFVRKNSSFFGVKSSRSAFAPDCSRSPFGAPVATIDKTIGMLVIPVQTLKAYAEASQKFSYNGMRKFVSALDTDSSRDHRYRHPVLLKGGSGSDSQVCSARARSFFVPLDFVGLGDYPLDDRFSDADNVIRADFVKGAQVNLDPDVKL